MPPEGTFEGNRSRGKLTAMRQMPDITDRRARLGTAQARRHSAIAAEARDKPATRQDACLECP